MTSWGKGERWAVGTSSALGMGKDGSVLGLGFFWLWGLLFFAGDAFGDEAGALLKQGLQVGVLAS